MIENLGNTFDKRQKLVDAAREFAPLLATPNYSEEEIDDAIEELRPLRMHIHALEYGDAPGFRKMNQKNTGTLD
jgi:hypothetical protein